MSRGDTGDLRRALYVFTMSEHTPRVKEETKDRMWEDVVRACRVVHDREPLLVDTYIKKIWGGRYQKRSTYGSQRSRRKIHLHVYDSLNKTYYRVCDGERDAHDRRVPWSTPLTCKGCQL